MDREKVFLIQVVVAGLPQPVQSPGSCAIPTRLQNPVSLRILLPMHSPIFQLSKNTGLVTH